MEALIVSTGLVALAEIGDKTQLLSFVLAARLKKRIPIVLGIVFATLANHFLAGYAGAWLAQMVSAEALRWIVAISFFAFGAWALVPDTLDEGRDLRGAGVFLTTLIAFFMVEMGDKTQIATVALAARFPEIVSVVLGTTFGMMLANTPVIFFGNQLAARIPLKFVRWTAAACFAALAVGAALI